MNNQNYPNYIPTPLQQRITKQVKDGNPRAFVIADLGEGPILTYRGRHIRLDYVSIDLTHGAQHIEIPRIDVPPYTVLLAQEGTRVNLCLYMSHAAPVLEHSAENGMQGQVFAAVYAKDGRAEVTAHALFQPTFSTVLVPAIGHESLLMEQDPGLCDYSALCASVVAEFFRIKNGDETDELYKV